MRALHSQLVWLGHSSITFKFMPETHTWTWVPPHIQGEHPEEWGLPCSSKILPRLLLMVTGLSEVSTTRRFMFLFHNSSTVPVWAMLFQKEQQLPLTQRTHKGWKVSGATASIIRECKTGRLHSKLSQMKPTLPVLAAKLNSVPWWNVVRSTALWILIFMVFFCSLRVFRTTQKLFNVWFAGQCLLRFVNQIQTLGNLLTLQSLVLNATH